MAVAFVAVLLAGCTGKQVAGVATDVGLGDPYFPDAGNAGYQVEQYDLRVRYDPDSDELAGVATIDAVATDELATMQLDLVGLAVDEVTVDGAGATHDTAADKLTVELPAAVSAGDQLQVAVDYGGVPEPVGSPQLGSNGFHHTDGGAFAVGQPDSARTWFPVNDHPRDKAIYTIEVAVPEGLAAVSNGVPRGRDTVDGWTTWRWAERTPMASYLVTLAIGEYRVDEWEHDDGRPVVTAVQTELPREVDEQLAQTPQIADVLAQWFGPYPVDAYGGIALSDPRIGFALETQSRPVYGPSFFVQGQSGEVRDGTWVIVHELAHQWFGNSVSVHEWREIWLNEGFATYAEWLWEEHDGGDTVQESFDLYWDGPGAEEQFWQVPPGDPGPERLFASPVYVRGAMTLHALRLAVGDDDFFQILQEWAQEQRNGTATTAELVTLAERVSGESLQALFDEWLYRADRPPHPS